MHLLSTVPTLLLAALTFGSTSQQTPVDGLEQRQVPPPPPPPPAVPALPEIPTAFGLEVSILKLTTVSVANVISVVAGLSGDASVSVDLLPVLREVQGLVQLALARAQNLATTMIQGLQNDLVDAETQFANTLTALLAALNTKFNDASDASKKLVGDSLTTLSGSVTPLLEQITRVVNNLPAAIQNHDAVLQAFSTTSLALKTTV